MNSDMEELLRAASYVAANNVAFNQARLSGQDHEVSTTQVLQDRSNSLTAGQGTGDLSALAMEVSRLVEATSVAAANNVAPAKVSTSVSSAQDSSTGETILRTAAMMTGVGPIVTGLMKLFRSGDPEPVPALERFQAAPSVSVEAGLSASREYGAIRYAQGGLPDTAGVSQPSATQTQTIQVNIQAFDSQSFLDRQDDIARAVREAMLHSNSLNDVVLEL